jgi:hypothetical protein
VRRLQVVNLEDEGSEGNELKQKFSSALVSLLGAAPCSLHVRVRDERIPNLLTHGRVVYYSIFVISSTGNLTSTASQLAFVYLYSTHQPSAIAPQRFRGNVRPPVFRAGTRVYESLVWGLTDRGRVQLLTRCIPT